MNLYALNGKISYVVRRAEQLLFNYLITSKRKNMDVRNFTLLCFCLLTLNLAFGQKKTAHLAIEKVVQNTYQPTQNGQARSLEMDTVLAPILFEDCSETAFTLAPMGVSGFVGGTNGFMDLEKAQRMIANNSNINVTEIIVFFGDAIIAGDGELRAKIYEADAATNGPGALVGTSDPIRASEINLDPEIIAPTLFTFPTAPFISGDEFFISIDFSELYVSQDSVGLLLTDTDCGFAEDAWELFSDGVTWASLSDTDISFGILSNFLMLAILELDGVSSTQEIVSTGGAIRLYNAFPNPASSNLTVAYDLEVTSTVQLEIYSMDGKILQQEQQSVQVPGQYQVQLPIAQLPEGMYLYGLTTDKGRLMNKFTVGR